MTPNPAASTPNPAAGLTAKQIRRRANDLDSQIRLGLEEGNIRQVVKNLGDEIKEICMLRTTGTPEQVAAFPKPLFLIKFIRAWNRTRNDKDFVEKQVEELEKFDAAQIPAAATATIPSGPPKAPAPRPRPTKPPAARAQRSTPPAEAGPSRPPVRVLKAPPSVSPSPPPRPAVPTRPPPHALTDASPSRSDRVPTAPKRRRPEVVLTPRPHPPKKFSQVEASGDEYDPSLSPSPPPPTRHRVRQPTSGRGLKTLVVYTKACERCRKGKRDCEVDEISAACKGCKARKYGCDQTGKTEAKTMTVTRPGSDSEDSDEDVKDRKGRKRRAESPPPKKTVRKVKADKKVKVEKAEKKGRGAAVKGKGRQLPKSAPTVRDSSDEEEDEAIAVDEESEEERKPKRARHAGNFKGEHDKRLAVLEERVKLIDKVAEVANRTSQRMDTMEDNVHRFTGSLDTFLSRIRIDDRLRLVPDDMRIGGPDSPLPPVQESLPPTATRSESPGGFPMDEDEDGGIASSSVADTRTTPSESHGEFRLVDVFQSQSGPTAPPDPSPIASPLTFPEPDPTPDPTDHLPLPAGPAPAPTFNVIPATPQGSQTLSVPTPIPTIPPPPLSSTLPSPVVAEVDAVPPPRSTTRNRSRTPATALLGVQEGRTTRSRSRSKTPI